MLTGPPPLASISPTVFFTGPSDKWDLKKNVLLSLNQYSFNVKINTVPAPLFERNSHSLLSGLGL